MEHRGSPALRSTDSLQNLTTPGVANVTVSGETASGRPLILHFNGSSWTRSELSMPREPSSVSAVNATSASDAWVAAVASGGSALERWTTVGWAPGIPVDVSGGSCVGQPQLRRLEVIDDSDVWGLMCSHGVFRWNGTQVVVEAGPSSPGFTDMLYNGIGASSASNVWVVGIWIDTLTFPEQGPLAGFFDGLSWTSPQPPSYGTYHAFNAVAAASPGSVWAVGVRYVFADHKFVAQYNLLDNWNGHSWSEYGGPNPSTNSELLGAAAVPHSKTFWAVGDDGIEDLDPALLQLTRNRVSGFSPPRSRLSAPEVAQLARGDVR